MFSMLLVDSSLTARKAPARAHTAISMSRSDSD